MTALGVAAHAIRLNKYIVYLRLGNGSGKFCIIVLGSKGYGITPFANFVSTIKLKYRKTCNICFNKKKRFKICFRCNYECCSNCFYKSTEQVLACSYCRYTLSEHFIYYKDLLKDNFMAI